MSALKRQIHRKIKLYTFEYSVNQLQLLSTVGKYKNNQVLRPSSAMVLPFEFLRDHGVPTTFAGPINQVD